MAVQLPSGISGAVLPCADIRDTAFLGALKRILSSPPEIDDDLFNRFTTFVDAQISDLPILMNEPSFEVWIEEVNQPESRKQEYRVAFEKYKLNKLKFDQLAAVYGTDDYIFDPDFEKWLQIAAFIKSEWYLEVKPNRGINPRNIEYMPAVGPSYAEISKLIFSLPEFIKYIPIKDRPKYIFDKLSNAGSICVQTDYKSFENSFTRRIQENIEMKLYKHCLSRYPWLYNLCHAQCINNKIYSPSMNIQMDCARMSGEMCTSLGNGFTNLMLMRFFCKEHNITDAQGVIEGDDGLFTYHGTPLYESFFNKLGFQIDISEKPLNEASFCGNIFTENSLKTLADPLEVMATASYTMQGVGARPTELNKLCYLMGFSILCQYGNCPILCSFARKQIRDCILNDPDVRIKAISYLKTSRKLDWWSREILSKCIHEKVEDSTIHYEDRLLVEKMYEIPVTAQIEIEKQLDKSAGILNSDLVNLLYSLKHPEWVRNFSNIHYDDHTPVRYLEYDPVKQDVNYSEGEELTVSYHTFYK